MSKYTRSDKELAIYIENRLQSMETEKSFMTPIFDQIGVYVNLRYENQQGENAKGEFATSKVWETTAIYAAEMAASAIVNAVYPSARRSIMIRPKRYIKSTEAVKEYFRTINKTFQNYLDNQKNNLYNAIIEVVNDLVKYGTSGLLMNIDEEADFFTELPISYRSMPLKSLYIDEGKAGKIDTIYYRLEYTIMQLVNEYGLENISANLQKKYNNGVKTGKLDINEKIKVIMAIEPAEYIYDKKSKFNKKYSSIHMEEDTKHIVKKSGFSELPVIPARLAKRSNEIWGRCPAIDNLPTILLANILAEAVTMAVEKQLEPPLVVINNGVLGPDLNTSAGAVTPMTITGNQITNPVFPISTVGDIKTAVAFLETVKIMVQKAFYMDWLFDMGAQRERTLGEVNLQNDLRGRAVGSLYARIETELALPLTEKSFTQLFKTGQLGVFKNDDMHKALKTLGISDDVLIFIPDELKVVKNIRKRKVNREEEFPSDFYEVVFISPAARARNREEIEGLTEFLQLSMPVFQIKQEVMDTVNFSNYIKILAELTNVDVDLLNSDEMITQIQATRAQIQQQQMQMMAAEKQSKIQRDNAMASSMEAATYSKLGMGGVK